MNPKLSSFYAGFIYATTSSCLIGRTNICGKAIPSHSSGLFRPTKNLFGGITAAPFRWCDLGEALDRKDDLPRAKYCFERAVELGPNSRPVLLRAAYFHFGAGQQSRALQLTARTLTLVRDLRCRDFALYSRLGIGIEDVLRHGMPKDLEVAQPYYVYLLKGWKWGGPRSGLGLDVGALADR